MFIRSRSGSGRSCRCGGSDSGGGHLRCGDGVMIVVVRVYANGYDGSVAWREKWQKRVCWSWKQGER